MARVESECRKGMIIWDLRVRELLEVIVENSVEQCGLFCIFPRGTFYFLLVEQWMVRDNLNVIIVTM